MINLAKQSKMEPAEIVKRAARFFGPSGLGLEIHDADQRNARFQGGGGFVAVKAAPTPRGSDVKVLSQEWEQQAQQFLDKL
jgi:hypothetical protein